MNTNAVDFFDKGTNDIPESAGLVLAVWEIVTPGNIGHIIRLAHNIGADRALFINEAPNFRHSKIKKTAGSSLEQIDWSFISKERFLEILGSGYQLVALETCTGSENIFKTVIPAKSIILAGSESHGIAHEILALAHLKVHIPMPGSCKSMNIAQALSVAAFEWFRQNS